MKITFLGHASLLIEVNDHRLLVDPFITGNEKASGKVNIDSLKPDFILLTHAHQDHTLDVEAIAKSSGATIVSNYEIAMYYQEKKDEDRFVEHAELAVHSLSDEVNLLAALSVTYAERQQPDPAIKYGKTALAMLPTKAAPEGMAAAKWEEIRSTLTAEAHYGTGTGYLFKAFNLGGADHLMTPAFQHLQEATRLDPTMQAAQFYLGFAHQLKEDFESAIPCYAKAAALTGSNTALAKQQLEQAYKKVHGDTKGVNKLISEQKKIFESAAAGTGQ